MSSYNEMIQALKDLKIPNCTKEKHFDNLLFLKFFNHNSLVEFLCGQCILEEKNQIDSKQISIKVILKLILDELFQKITEYNEVETNSIKEVEKVISKLTEMQIMITEKIKSLEIMKQSMQKYQTTNPIYSDISNIFQAIFATENDHKCFEGKINELLKNFCIDLNSNKKVIMQYEPVHSFEQEACETAISQLNGLISSMALISLQPTIQFDYELSDTFFSFTNNNSIAIFKQNSEAYPNEYSTITDYKFWPNVRVNRLIEYGTLVIKFKMSGNGFFGLGTPELPANGFPGHTPFGYMNYIQGTIAWHNKQTFKNQDQLLNNKINLQNKEVIMTINADKKRCKINVDNQEIEREYPLPNPVYIVFALRSGQVELIQ